MNTFSPEEAAAAYERHAVPETGQIFDEAGDRLPGEQRGRRLSVDRVDRGVAPGRWIGGGDGRRAATREVAAAVGADWSSGWPRGRRRSCAAIGERLFLRPWTLEWHLRKVFAKLEIRSRRELSSALPASESVSPAA